MPRSTGRITDRKLAAMKPGDVLSDDEPRGFRARKQRDTVVFEFRYKDKTGVRRTLRIGPWGRRPGYFKFGDNPWEEVGDPRNFGLLQARAKAKEFAAKLAAGFDPRLEAGPEGLTLEQALTLHITGIRKKGRSERTVEFYQSNISKHLPDWKNLHLRDISRPMTRKRHDEITKRAGSYAANAVMRALRAVWNAARREDEKLGECPIIAVYWNPEKPRDTALLPDQLADWWVKLQSFPNAVLRDYYLFLLFTGLRRRSASEMRWAHVDFLRRTLHIPRPKGGEARAFMLPLTDFLTDLLQSRRAANAELYPDGPWVFPAKSKSGHIEEPKQLITVKRNGKSHRIKNPDMPSPHALRHTFVSVCENRVGIPLLHTKLLANHTVPRDITLGYASASDIEALRGSMEKVTDYLLTCIQQDGAEPISLRAWSASGQTAT